MDFSENKPIYQQISDFFCNQILMKKWKTGDRIPSVREMAVTVEVNPNTAIRAFHSLQGKEILYNERGVGYFVAEDAFSKVMTLKRQEFIEEKLPRLMQDLDQLDISPGDLNELYENIINEPRLTIAPKDSLCGLFRPTRFHAHTSK